MNIKISKSQLINILNEEKKKLTDEDRFKLLDIGLNALASNNDDSAVSAIGDAIISSQLGDSEMSDMDKIDILPLDPGSFRVSSPFGPRNIGGNASRNHEGIDLAVKSGSPAYAVANGVVIKSKNIGKCGGHVRIKHDNHETKYCHLKRWVVEKGEQVSKGQLIGYTGGGKSDPNRGNSMGAHLHYEVIKGGQKINPSYVHSELA